MLDITGRRQWYLRGETLHVRRRVTQNSGPLGFGQGSGRRKFGLMEHLSYLVVSVACQLQVKGVALVAVSGAAKSTGREGLLHTVLCCGVHLSSLTWHVTGLLG